MTTPQPDLDRPTTLSDIISRLGDIPLDRRIRWVPRPGTATLEDVEHVEKAATWFEARIGPVIAFYLELWLARNNIGFVSGGNALTRMQSGDMRIPDVYVARWERFPTREVPNVAVTSFVPDLAIEALSQGNTEKELRRKQHEFFENGTSLCWLVRPNRQTVDVYQSVDKFKSRSIDDTLSGQTILEKTDLFIDCQNAQVVPNPDHPDGPVL